MMFLFSQNSQRGPETISASFLWSGMLCTFFGFAILIAPNLLAYFVASLLLLLGISLLGTGWRLRRML